MSLRLRTWSCAALLAGLLLPAIAQQRGLKLHVPSPDSRDQVIYFVLTDRFDDGNPRNNDQGLGRRLAPAGARGRQLHRRRGRPEGAQAVERQPCDHTALKAADAQPPNAPGHRFSRAAEPAHRGTRLCLVLGHPHDNAVRWG